MIPDLPYTFRFAIFASGFRSGSLVHKGFYDEDINLPSLHVYGESDSIIPKGKNTKRKVKTIII